MNAPKSGKKYQEIVKRGCGGKLDYALDGVIQDRCYVCVPEKEGIS